MKNEGRLICISDIHGCVYELKNLIEQIKPTKNDKFVFLGDYIDRGGHVREVILYLMKFKHDFPNTVLLIGNHEIMYTDALSGAWDVASYIYNGGGTTLKDFPANDNKILLDFIGTLELYHETEDFIFVHAGLSPMSFDNQKENECFEETALWIRGNFLNSNYDWGKVVVHGHTPGDSVVYKENRIGIDTGCVFGNFLTGLDLTNGKEYRSNVVKVDDKRKL